MVEIKSSHVNISPHPLTRFVIITSQKYELSTFHSASGEICLLNESRPVLALPCPRILHSSWLIIIAIAFVRKKRKHLRVPSSSLNYTQLQREREKANLNTRKIRHGQRKREPCLHRQARRASWTLWRFNLSLFMLSYFFNIFYFLIWFSMPLLPYA